jgi:hypothetical protein
LAFHPALPTPHEYLNSIKEWGRYGVFGVRVQCFMMGELK